MNKIKFNHIFAFMNIYLTESCLTHDAIIVIIILLLRSPSLFFSMITSRLEFLTFNPLNKLSLELTEVTGDKVLYVSHYHQVLKIRLMRCLEGIIIYI